MLIRTLAPGLAIFCLGLGLIAGCVTKDQAKAQAREAYLAGQRDAMVRMQLAGSQTNFVPGMPPGPPPQGKSVTLNGPFRNQVVPWVHGMTLTKAILAGEYIGPTDPTAIYIVRRGQANLVDPKLLLSGQDTFLLPGDIIQAEIQPTAPQNEQR
jgi:hypothetical protein